MAFSYWNTIGPAKEFAHPLKLERLAQWVPLEARIIDYGCGYGRGVQALARHGYTSVVGVDPAEGMIAAARERCPALAFETLRDPPRVPRPDESFDVALLTAVLTCVPADADQRAIVDELTRLVRPGGVLHVADFWLQTDTRNLERYDRARPPGAPYGTFSLPEGVTLRHQSREQLQALTVEYDQLALDDTLVRTMNGHEALGFHWYGRRR